MYSRTYLFSVPLSFDSHFLRLGCPLHWFHPVRAVGLLVKCVYLCLLCEQCALGPRIILYSPAHKRSDLASEVIVFFV
jgi:hypothetical protein